MIRAISAISALAFWAKSRTCIAIDGSVFASQHLDGAGAAGAGIAPASGGIRKRPAALEAGVAAQRDRGVLEFRIAGDDAVAQRSVSGTRVGLVVVQRRAVGGVI